MPEANVLYIVTAVVVAGLIAWVSYVLKTAKEPWAREPSVTPKGADPSPPIESNAPKNESAESKDEST
jgi:hypothetical protein